jgi:membrane-bound lytic murein transglycosylase D
VIEHNRERFGFADVKPSASYAYAGAKVPPGTALAEVARAVGTDEKSLRSLNPELRRGRTPPDRAWTVRLPAGKQVDDAAAADLAEAASRWAIYPARAGEPLEEVATLHGVSMAELKRLNGWVDTAEVRPGVALIVPRVSDEHATEYAAKLARERAKTPRIVALPEPGLGAEGRARVFYRVQAGDTLAEVARALGVSGERLRTWNGLDEGASLQPKMVLAALVDPALDRSAVSLLGEGDVKVYKTGSEEFLDAMLREKGKKRVRIKAEEGDTLTSIAEANDLSPGSLARVNKIAPSAKLKAGQALWIYVDAEKWDRMQAEKAEAERKAKAEAERREREEAERARLAKLKKKGKPGKKPKSAEGARPKKPRST